MTYTRHGEEYLVTKDGPASDLYIPMRIINEAITNTANADFGADQIEAYIRNAMAVLGSLNAEAAVVQPSEETSLDNLEADRLLELVIDGEMYRVDTSQFETLRDLATWMSEILNQAMKRVVEANVAGLEKELENLGFSSDGLKLTIKM